MKKAGVLCSMAMIAVISFSGCGVSTDADTNTLFIGANGKITEVAVEEFEKDYYNEDELKEYIDEVVESYKNDGGKGSVSVKKYTVQDQTAKLVIEYDSYESYAAFNEAELYVGTVVQAKAEGYEFPEDFYTPDQAAEESTESVSDSVITEDVAEIDVLADEKNKVLILEQNTDVQVKGEILYVSDHVKVTGKDTATVYGEGTDSADVKLVYIIYK